MKPYDEVQVDVAEILKDVEKTVALLRIGKTRSRKENSSREPVELFDFVGFHVWGTFR